MGMVFNIQKFSLHDGPGIRTVVFLKGCPLRCKWCANPESQRMEVQILQGMEAERKGREMDVEDVVKACMQDWDFYEESGGGVTLSGGEPLAQAGFARQLLEALGEKGMHRAVETTGFAEEEVFASVLGHVELVLFDVKHWDSRRHREGTGVGNEGILKNLQAAVASGKEVLPRIPVIPGFNDGLQDAAGFGRLLKGLGLRRAQLLPFHQFGESKYAGLGMEYAYAGIDPLHEEDLGAYQAAFAGEGVEAFF